MADILLREEDLKFASTMVHTLNTILLTSTELFQLRNQLKDLRTLVPCLRALAGEPCVHTGTGHPSCQPALSPRRLSGRRRMKLEISLGQCKTWTPLG